MCMNGKLRGADGTGKILPNMRTVELDTSLWFLLFLLLLGFFLLLPFHVLLLQSCPCVSK